MDDELKKIKPKDPKLMTARQRAMLERKTDKDGPEQLLSLPTGNLLLCKPDTRSHFISPLIPCMLNVEFFLTRLSPRFLF